MTLTQLAYVSRPAPGVTITDVESILANARPGNAAKGLTGFLVFTPTLFAQVLEGERGTLTQLLSRILTDHRHENVMLIGCREIEQRRFGEWSMGFLPRATGIPERLTRDDLKFDELVDYLLEAADQAPQDAPRSA